MHGSVQQMAPAPTLPSVLESVAAESPRSSAPTTLAPVPVVELPGVAEDAQALLAGLADEWPRLRAGAGLPALGEGKVCDTCEARGLCRRDHWSAS